MRHFAPRWIPTRGEQQKVEASYDDAIFLGWIHDEIRIVYSTTRPFCATKKKKKKKKSRERGRKSLESFHHNLHT